MNIDPALIIRAWRDPEFAASLPVETRRAIPDSPAGEAPGLIGVKLRGGSIEPQGTVSNDCNTVSNSCNTVSNSCNTVSNSCNTVSNSCNTVSNSCNTVSNSCNTVANGCNTVSNSCNTVSNSCDTRMSCTRVSQCRG